MTFSVGMFSSFGRKETSPTKLGKGVPTKKNLEV